MEVLIVSKTHMANNACVGGLVLGDNRSVRLRTEDNENQPEDTDFEIGDIWDIHFVGSYSLIEPHVEDVIVLEKRRVGSMDNLAKLFRERNLVHWTGPIENTFDGLLHWTGRGRGYVYVSGKLLRNITDPPTSTGRLRSDVAPEARREPQVQLPTRLPTQSVGFWAADHDLQRYNEGDNIRYRFKNRDLKFVGYQTPVEVIPAGTIIRLSLTRAKRFEPLEMTALWLQLSGWYSELNIVQPMLVEPLATPPPQLFPQPLRITHIKEVVKGDETYFIGVSSGFSGIVIGKASNGDTAASFTPYIGVEFFERTIRQSTPFPGAVLSRDGATFFRTLSAWDRETLDRMVAEVTAAPGIKLDDTQGPPF